MYFPHLPNTETNQKRLELLNQKGIVVWLTGLSGSGKSTIASGLEKKLTNQGYISVWLDGDNLRCNLNSDLGFNQKDRLENVRRAAEISKLFVDVGIIVICSLISPDISMRRLAKTIIGSNNFFCIYVNSDIDVCMKRDVKGLYNFARSGEIPNFTGMGSKYTPPSNPFLELDSSKFTETESVETLYKQLLPHLERIK
ncbi:MAG: adenylyl-sulfate kinase [Bacteroidetes bacterium]|nr:adenylyl-sulfate kinase [Bacteroidota bacterium]